MVQATVNTGYRGRQAKKIALAVVHGLDPRPVELLTAQLSLWFAVVFVTSESPNRPQPVALWVLWCAAAATLKAAGVLATLGYRVARWSRPARVAGNALGLGFWTVLAVVLFILARGGIAWGGYAIVALGQGWCFYRIAIRGR